MDLKTAYGVLIFYGVLSIIMASAGFYFAGPAGFSNGYLVGTAISVGLWMVYGKKISGI